MKSLPFYKKRYIVMAIIAAFSLILPFIRINDHHIFLLSFDHKRLELVGIAFDMQEFYLMPFLVMFLFLFILAITTFGGRVWCGWGCPQTIFRIIYRDLIEGALFKLRRRANKQKSIDYSKPLSRVSKTIAVLIWSALAFVAASNLTWYFVPPEDFFVYIQSPADHPILVGMVLIAALFLIYDVTKLGESFCAYICPYVRVQSSMYDRDTIYTIYDEKRGGTIYGEGGAKVDKHAINGDCIGCEACVLICPSHIDIRKGLQLECINCLECSDACATVMGKAGKPNLINWTSARESTGGGKTRFLRFRTVAYAVLLVGVLVALALMSGTKETMLLNINKSNRVYKIDEVREGTNRRVINDYIFLVSNTSAVDHTYYFEVLDPVAVKIKSPLSPFVVSADSKDKEIVELYSDELLSDRADGDTLIKVHIRAYAIDDPSVEVFREAIFAYPPKSKLGL
ncbi:cytochrome c oxidase accessory protein CcoG [Campylobacterota bacterium]|nr:cytochrome c oxidase accessory protein CcoG [Campylobacterota bacterium]